MKISSRHLAQRFAGSPQCITFNVARGGSRRQLRARHLTLVDVTVNRMLAHPWALSHARGAGTPDRRGSRAQAPGARRPGAVCAAELAATTAATSAP
jgi:hypothetical protein